MSLNLKEVVQIRQWLQSPDQALNLTRASTTYAKDNMVYNIEAYRPTKADALTYLASPSTASPPERYAWVTIHHGARLEPTVKNYLMGPLPVGKYTYMRELNEIYHWGNIPYNARGFDRDNEIGLFLAQTMPTLAEPMKVSLRALLSLLYAWFST